MRTKDESPVFTAKRIHIPRISYLKRVVQQYPLAFILLVFMIVVSVLNGSFFTLSNFLVILLQVAVYSLLALGEFLTILTGGIDLSIGSIVGLAGVVGALLASHSGTGWLLIAVGGALLAGLIVGSINGLLVAWVKMPPFIVTLGTMTSALGFAYVLSGGQPISNVSNNFLAIGGGSLWHVPYPIFIMIVVLGVFYGLLRHTTFGTHVYATGGNDKAARIAGIKTSRILYAVYALSGLLAGLAGVILASQVTSGIATNGAGYELDAIAAVVIGGTSLMGGRGTFVGMVIGFLMLSVLSNGLYILNVSPFYIDVITGFLIIVAVAADAYVTRIRSTL